MSELRFDNRIAIVTGAGAGLGRAHALLLASRGAKVVVNDLGGSIHGGGKSSAAADKVVEEIKAAGGTAVANYDSVEDGDKIVKTAMDAFGQVDILINNAGILRDTSFQKMSPEDWDIIYRVHVLGAYRTTTAVWKHMLERGFGRIIFTASAAGIYGNFGQANYAMAKLGLVGFSNTLAAEGKKKGVLVNAIAPLAGSRLTETVLPPDLIAALKPEYVSPLVAYLAHEGCQETGGLYEVGGGFFGKLRWERAEGKTFKLGRNITPDTIKQFFSQISSFEKTMHPGSITESMQPIMDNLGTKSQGGNELIDVDEALGYEFPDQKSSYDERDLALYALGVGAARNPLDQTELQYVYELADGFKALPTYAVVPAVSMVLKMGKEGVQAPGMHYGLDRILHGEQYTELKRPLPTNAKLRHKIRIKDIFDKVRNALVVTEIRTFDESGEELMVNELTTFVRGAGGWGGERGPKGEDNAPTRAADAIVEEKIADNQALLYRLSGDWNPLHADPNFATAFGFEKPILHGLCTFGYAGRHVISKFAPKGDARFFKSIRVRFAESVFPGETIITEMWKESDTKIVFRCKVKERDKVVVDRATIEFYTEIPKPKPKAVAAAASAGSAPASSGPTVADIFWGMRFHVETNPSLVGQVGKVFQFKLGAVDYTLDLKNGKGSVTEGVADKPDCTLELSSDDFIGMATGKLNPQKLYFGGKLKISGDVMASQKLDFLQKVDQAKVAEAMKAAGYAPGGGAAPAGAGASEGEFVPTSGEVFAAIGDYVQNQGDIIAKVGKTFLFKLTSPESVWTIDVKNGKGGVSQGAADKPDCTLEISDTDFMAMVAGKADAMKLFSSGKLKISGDVMASQKLTFLQKMDPKRAKEVAMSARKSGAGAAKPTTSAVAKEPAAKKVFAALSERLTKNPKLAAEVKAVLCFKVTGPESSFTVDLSSGSGTIKEGAGLAAATFTLADEDLLDLAKSGDARDLYQRGKLRVDGDARFAQRLSIIKGLVG